MRRHLIALALLPALVLTAACGDDTDVSTGDDPTITDGGASGSGTDAGGDVDSTEVAISIEVGGGFVPYGYDFAAVPTVIAADGTAYTGGLVTAIFPGPALSPVLTGQVDADELASLLDAAEEVGLTSDEALDAGEPNVTDMPTTTIRVTVDGETAEHSVYGLSAGAEVPEGVDLGLTDAQAEVRAAIAAFVADVTDAVSAVASEPYEADAYDILPQPLADAGAVEDVTPNQLDWPGAEPLPEDGSCVHLEGADAAAFAALLPEATQITEWTDASNGAQYRITARAVIPGFDREC